MAEILDRTVVVGPFQCNCRILVCKRTLEAVVIDPGDEPQRILSELKAIEGDLGQSIQVKGLLHTHAHLDHVGATRSVRETFDSARIHLHKDDEELYLALKKQGELFGFQYEDPLPIDHYVQDTEMFSVGDMSFEVLHTPGHSPGSVCFRLGEEQLFSGDTLFQNSIGRTDLWGGNLDQLLKNIRSRLLTLDDETRVCPGHGPESKVGIEKRQNPFLQ